VSMRVCASQRVLDVKNAILHRHVTVQIVLILSLRIRSHYRKFYCTDLGPW
jgi:hypothetical protein